MMTWERKAGTSDPSVEANESRATHKHDRVCDDKRPAETDHDPSDLETELSEVSVEPPSWDGRISL